jgi:hypothetical protein
MDLTIRDPQSAIYELLPAIHRIRDAEQGEPLKALLAVIAEQVAVLEEDLAQLYDDQFVETAAAWAVPYIGDLIGYRSLHGVTPKVSSPRAEVANTIGYRRRKGTAAMLEQLARDVTGWDARAVEFFELLGATQYMNHLRPDKGGWLDVRGWAPAAPYLDAGTVAPDRSGRGTRPRSVHLERIDTAFETAAHTIDVRRIASGRGRYNIPNIGIFLWRLGDYSRTGSPASRLDARRYLFSPLDNNAPLFNDPVAEDEITHLAEPADVPMPISRRALAIDLDAFYGPDRSLLLTVGGNEVPAAAVMVCDLSDHGTGWAHKPADKYAIDPVLGRIATPEDQPDPRQVIVTYHYGFSADMGGGEYDRADTLDGSLGSGLGVPAPHATLADALVALGGAGAVEIADSGRYRETLNVHAAAGARIELRAADGAFPTVILRDEMQISGDAGSEVTINGLLLTGAGLRVTGELRLLRLRHCTLVPGLSLKTDGTPQSPNKPSLIIEAPNVTVVIDNSIVGGLRVVRDAQVSLEDSILDACGVRGVAYAAEDNVGPGGELRVERCTVIGKVHTGLLRLASNAIFVAELRPADQATWAGPVVSERRQEGCVRFSHVPWESLTPRRYQCQPAAAADSVRVRPLFTALRYGMPGYGQLALRCAVEIRRGADDEAEMGAFHDLFQPQRETNLRVRLDEYLRFGLEAGLFYAS